MIDVAQRAGLSLEEIRELVEHGNDPMSDRLRELAERRLPEIDALIERATRVRAWLADATQLRLPEPGRLRAVRRRDPPGRASRD